MTTTTTAPAVSDKSERSNGASVIAGATAQPRKHSTSRATRSAAANAKTTPPKPAAKQPVAKQQPAKPALAQSEKRIAVLNLWIAAGAELVKQWDAKSTGITRDEAAKIISERAKYAGPKCSYPAPLTVK